ncbi:hypothetical protein GGF32_000190 [Allomyces javanicus]|nr:hypothetical protein GGF32_000190 [Allomyces javanicus]
MLAQPAPVPLVSSGKKFRRATAEELSAVTLILAQERSKAAPPPAYLHLHHHLAPNALADRAPHLPAPTAMPASPAASPPHWRPILPAPAPAAPTRHSPLLLAPTPPATEDASMMLLAAGPATTTTASTPPPPPPRRRNRTIMSAFQTCVLRRVLALTAFPSTQVREMLAAELGMPPRTVQIWFQNQRQKAKARAKLAPTGPTAAAAVDAAVGSALDAGVQMPRVAGGGGAAVAAPAAPALVVPVTPTGPALAPATHPFVTQFATAPAHIYAPPHGPFMIAPTLPAAFFPPTPAPAPPPTPSTAMAGLSVRSVPPTPTSASSSMQSHDAVLQAHHVQFLLHHAHASSTSMSSSPTSAVPSAAMSGNMPTFTYAFDAHARTPAPAPILMPTPPESTSPSLAGSLAIAPAAEGDTFSTSLASSRRASPTTTVFVDDVTLPPIAPLSAATHHASAPSLPRVTLDAGDSPSNAVLHGPRRQRKPRPAPIAVVPTTLAALAGTTPGRRIAHGRLRGPPATAPVVPSAAAHWPAPATPIEMPMSACRAPDVSPLDLLAAAAAVLEPVPSPTSPNA